MSGTDSSLTTRPRVVIVCSGAFNPPTYAHLRLFERARDFLERSLKMTVVEGLMSPHSDFVKIRDIVPAKHRLRMVEAALRKSSWLRSGNWECTQNEQPSILDVMNYYKKEYSSKYGNDVQLFLLCGGDFVDSLTRSSKSHNCSQEDIDELFSRFGVVVTYRPNTNPSRTAYLLDVIRKNEGNLHLIYDETYPSDASSTRLRTAIRRGESIKYCTSDDVIEYITDHDLYLGQFNHHLPGCSFFKNTPTKEPSLKEETIDCTFQRPPIGQETAIDMLHSTDNYSTASDSSSKTNSVHPPSEHSSKSNSVAPETPRRTPQKEVIMEPMTTKIPEEFGEHFPNCPLNKESPLPKRKSCPPAPCDSKHSPVSQAPAPPIRMAAESIERMATMKRIMEELPEIREPFHPITQSTSDVWQSCPSPSLPSPPSPLKGSMYAVIQKTPKKTKHPVEDVRPDPIKILPTPQHWIDPVESPNYDNVTLDELLAASTSWAEYMTAQCKELDEQRDLRELESQLSIAEDRQLDNGSTKQTPGCLRHPHEKEKTKESVKKKTWQFLRGRSLKDKDPEENEKEKVKPKNKVRGTSHDAPSERISKKTNGFLNGGCKMPNLVKTARMLRPTESKRSIRFANALTKSAEDIAACRIAREDPMSQSYHDASVFDDDTKITLSFRRYRLAATPETTV